MNNSPHHLKHLRDKAIRTAVPLIRNIAKEKKAARPLVDLYFSLKGPLTKMDAKNAHNMLTLFKKHLEHSQFHQTWHDAKRSTPGMVEGSEQHRIGKPHNPKKLVQQFEKSNLERSKNLGRHMNKKHDDHGHGRKAA